MNSQSLAVALPKSFPRGWRELENSFMKELGAPDGHAPAFRRSDGLRVVITSQIEQDGRPWVHISVSRSDRLPSWFDLKDVKNLFLGPEKSAIQVLPAERDFVNIHPYCLHLWHCLDGGPVPDFTWGMGTI